MTIDNEQPIFLINCDRPFHHYVSGEFNAQTSWQMKKQTLENGFKLFIMSEGSMTVSVNGRSHHLVPGDTLLIAEGDSYASVTPTPSSIKFYWFDFFAKDECQTISEGRIKDLIDDRKTFLEVANNVILPRHYSLQDFETINTICLETLALTHSIQYTDALASYALTLLILQISNDFIKSLHKVVTEGPQSLLILQWIKANISSDLTVKSVADHFDLNYRYLGQLVKKETGQTVTHYINEQKMTIARQLLLDSNLPLKVIADRAGFNDEKYFLRIFKKQVGMTPTNYRRNYMKKFLVNDTTSRKKMEQMHPDEH